MISQFYVTFHMLLSYILISIKMDIMSILDDIIIFSVLAIY